MGMTKKNSFRKHFILFFIVFLLAACSWQDRNTKEPVPDTTFPFTMQWVYPANNKIRAVSANDYIVALATDEKILAISPKNGRLLWELPFKVDKRFYPYLLAGSKMVVATNSEEMIAINSETGQIAWKVSATSENSYGFKVDYVSENYVVVERTASWSLEVYEIKTGKVLWDTFGNRGGAGVHVDESRNVLLIVGGRSSPRMFDLKTGELLAQQERLTHESSAYRFPFIYYDRNEEKEIAVTIGGLDIHTMEEQWSFYVGHKIYHLTLAGNNLLVSGEDGLYVLSQNGELLWKADGASLGEGINEKPLVIGENIFATVRNTGKIYAWRTDGQEIGTLSFPGKGGLKQIFGTGVSIASVNDLLLVISDDTLYAYGQ